MGDPVRDLKKAAAMFVGGCIAFGIAIGWKIEDLLVHHHGHEGLSEHFKR